MAASSPSWISFRPFLSNFLRKQNFLEMRNETIRTKEKTIVRLHVSAQTNERVAPPLAASRGPDKSPASPLTHNVLGVRNIR